MPGYAKNVNRLGMALRMCVLILSSLYPAAITYALRARSMYVNGASVCIFLTSRHNLRSMSYPASSAESLLVTVTFSALRKM